MEDKKSNESFFGFIQVLIYILILVNIYFVCIYQPGQNMVVLKLVYSLAKLKVFTSETASHLLVFVLILIVAFATRAKKDIEYKVYQHFAYPFLAGLLLFGASFLCLSFEGPVQ